jgi:hypothetical protein
LDVVLEKELSSGLGCSTARLVVYSGRNGVLSWYENEVGDVGSTDLLRLEVESECDISSSDRDVRRVVEVSIDVDLKVIRVSMVDVEVGNGRRSSVESLKTEKRGRNGEGDVVEIERTDGGTGDGCGARTVSEELAWRSKNGARTVSGSVKSEGLRLIVGNLSDERAESAVVDRFEGNVLELKENRSSGNVRLGRVRGNRE